MVKLKTRLMPTRWQQKQNADDRSSTGRSNQEGEITMADPITAADVQAFLGELGYSITGRCWIRFSAW
jgi:hypothetical protein